MAYVSDHAVIRYLERVEGVDIEAIRRRLATSAVDVAASFGCETVVRGDGSRLCLQGDVVRTVLASRKAEARMRRRGVA